MKKILSLLLVLVMCVSIFAGCNGNNTTTPGNTTTAPNADANGLNKAKEFLFSMYKDTRDTETAIDYTVVSSVMIGKSSYAITWTIEVESGDGACLSVEAGTDETTIKVGKNFTESAVKYNLVGTISDGNGKTETVKFAHTVPISKAVASIVDGTYVIATNGLSMAAMGESYTYGYPTANEVTATNFTKVDVVTIKNVEGGLTIQDCYGRYLYMKGTYNSFNLDTEVPSEGHIWELQTNDDGSYCLVNVLMQKTLAYSTSYTSWGAYAELGDGYSYSLTITPADLNSAHTHTEEVIPGKAATCTEDGLTEGKKCSECGAIIVAQQTIAAAHTWGEWEVTKKPTVSEDGERKHTCSVCNTTETEAVKYAATEWVVVETPEAGKAYKFALNQATLKKVLYFTGKMNGYYLATSDNTDDAVDMYLEAVEGGYRMYFMAGETKTYIDIVERDGEENKGKVNVKLVTEPTCVWTLNETLHIFTTTVAEKEWYLGTFDQMNDDGTVKKSLETISASEIKYITGDNASKLGVHQFVAQMYIEQEISDIVTAPKADTAYNVALNQATLEKVLYFTGKMSGYYLATSDNAADAVKVYVETVEGGYRLYFMADDTKTYIDIVERTDAAGKVNVKLVTEPTCVWTWNKTLNIFTTTVAEKEWYLGTYDQMNDDGTVKKSLETISASEIKYITGDNASKLGVHQFVAQLYVIKSEDTVPPAGEDTNKGVSISFAEKENRVSFDTESQVWQSNGITVTNAKANSKNNVADYSNPARFYQDSSLKIECKGMTKIVIDCNKGKDQGGKALVESIGTMEGVTATCDGLVVTITFAEAKDVLEIAALTAQVRVDTITVYTA